MIEVRHSRTPFLFPSPQNPFSFVSSPGRPISRQSVFQIQVLGLVLSITPDTRRCLLDAAGGGKGSQQFDFVFRNRASYLFPGEPVSSRLAAASGLDKRDTVKTELFAPP
jgi:hypothetical protein